MAVVWPFMTAAKAISTAVIVVQGDVPDAGTGEQPVKRECQRLEAVSTSLFDQFTATEGGFKSGVQRLRRSSSDLPQASFQEDQEAVRESQHLRAILRGKIVINAQPDLAAVP